METTIPTSEKLIDILNEIPTKVQEMYEIKLDTFFGEKYKLYIKSPMWMTLDETEIVRVSLTNYSLEIHCHSVVIVLKTKRVDAQIILL